MITNSIRKCQKIVSRRCYITILYKRVVQMAIEASLDLGNIANCQVNNVKVMNQCLHLVDTYRLQCDER